MPKLDMVVIENINTPGRKSNVNAEKYGTMRKVLLKILPNTMPGLTQAEMCQAVLPFLPDSLWPNGEKSTWWVKTVQLDLEAKGLVIRNTKVKPLRWYKV